MSLLVYKFLDYEHPAEREQYRSICKQLKAYYGEREELCLFIANYNIYDCELDGILIKEDAIMCVEFKNYGGVVTAIENGHWKLSDGTVIKGGSRKSVYQQANLNHVAIKRGFKDGLILPSKVLKNVAALVVFHQPIKLDNQLSAKTQSWLHICDEENFIEKVQDITSKFINFTRDDLMALIPKLALSEEYLDENYSNLEILQSNTTEPVTTKENDFQIYESPLSIPIDEKLDDERLELYNFVSRIINVLFKSKQCKVGVFNSVDVSSLFKLYGITFKKKYLITIESDGIEKYCEKISRFVSHPVRAINSDLIIWEEGVEIEPSPNNYYDRQKLEITESGNITFRKSKTILPHWLDKKIYTEYQAIYAPDHERYLYNLNLNGDELKVYLGTYFPRSYAEMFCIVDNLIQNKIIQELLNTDVINVLDCGCGTGGEVVGLITAIGKYLPKAKIQVIAIDGNEAALEIAKDIISSIPNKNIEVRLSLSCQIFKIENDMTKLAEGKNEYHFVLCDKMICELISKQILSSNAYSIVAQYLSSLLHDNGLLIMLDVTTKDEHTGFYYPQLMNSSLNEYVRNSKTIESLLPLSCACNEECRDKCFMQQTFYVSHSHKINDESRVCYRVLCKKSLKEKLPFTKRKEACFVIHPIKYKQGDITSICKHSTGNKVIDSFNINN